MSRKTWLLTSLLVAVSLVVTACGGSPAVETVEVVVEKTVEVVVEVPVEVPVEQVGETRCFGADGSAISVLGAWTDDKEAMFQGILAPVLEECNITLEYEGTHELPAVLQARVDGGNPPDISIMPSISALAQYEEYLVPMSELGAHLENYNQSWLDLGTVNGEVYGIFVRAGVESLVWYNPSAFEAAGYEVPETWEEFLYLVGQIRDEGKVPLSMGVESGAATGWTGIDFVQDILLRTQGADYVNGLVRRDIPWNDAGVVEAWEIYGSWATDPRYALGGAEGTVNTYFRDAILVVFSDPPKAYMVKQSDFAGGVISSEYPDLGFGTDYDFFVLPGPGGDPAAMQVWGDAMAAFNDTPAVRAVVAYLTSAEGAQAWAASGLDLSPNEAVTGEDYTDPISARKGDALAAAPAVSFGMGGLLPGEQMMLEFEAITAYVIGGDLTTILGDMQARVGGEVASTATSALTVKREPVELNGQSIEGEVEVNTGDVVRIGDNGFAEWVFLDDENIRAEVKPGTEVQLEALAAEEIRLFLFVGDMWITIESEGVRFVVATEVAKVEATGTEIIIDLEPNGDMMVACPSGEALVETADERVYISTGHGVDVVNGTLGEVERKTFIYFDNFLDDYEQEDQDKPDTLAGRYSRLKEELDNVPGYVANEGMDFENIEGQQVLIILDPEKDINTGNSDNIQRIHEWVDKGGGLFVVGERPGYFHRSSVNELLASYGMAFNDENPPEAKLIADFPLPDHDVTQNVKQLPLDNSGALDVDEGIVLGCADTGEVVLSAYEKGNVRVLALADSGTLRNGKWDRYTTIFIVNAIEWLAGR